MPLLPALFWLPCFDCATARATAAHANLFPITITFYVYHAYVELSAIRVARVASNLCAFSVCEVSVYLLAVATTFVVCVLFVLRLPLLRGSAAPEEGRVGQGSLHARVTASTRRHHPSGGVLPPFYKEKRGAFSLYFSLSLYLSISHTQPPLPHLTLPRLTAPTTPTIPPHTPSLTHTSGI